MSSGKKPFDLIRRGEKKPTLSGTLTFVGLRLADIPLQYALLSPSSSGLGVRLLTSLGLRTVYTDVPPPIPASLFLTSSRFGWTAPLAALPPTSLLLLLMSVGSAAKQIYWQLAISQESFPASAAAAVSAFNTIVNSGNALLFLALGTTSLFSRPQIAVPWQPAHATTTATATLALPLSTLVGVCLYVAGMSVEVISEQQRAAFKRRPENKGRLCKEGLWRWARHVNYFGYALWRGGYCMVGSGWVGGLIMTLWQGWDLGHRAVAVQDDYCSRRYGAQWTKFKEEVPYRIVPGVY
ncbi:hypothetical protein F5B17DRAFT_107886 [Nemania serpens]|nr:hypothetical protein F5B17DRAFT_107886 [Nemania serpens]